MVGVPGRARGCITCRRRKKGCDRGTPACERCIRAELACEGYETDMIWLNSNTNTASNQEHTKSLQPKDVSKIRPWSVTYSRDARAGPSVTLPASLARSAREQLYFGLFWNIMMPKGPRFSSQSMDLAPIGWTSLLEEFYNSETALRFATLAMATSVLGRLNDDEQLRLKGLQIYNWAVQEMIRAVREPNRAKSDSLIVAARLMAFFELLFGPDRDPRLDGWQRHSQGQLAMFLARGPDSFISGAAHQLFIDSRINFILIAIRQRVASPFSSDAWKTVPWTITGKSTKDKLLDIMDRIPYITSLLDSLSTSDSQTAGDELRTMIWQQCQDVEAALAKWRAQIDLSIYDYTIAESPISRPQTDSDFALLHLSCIYWCTCLLLSCIVGSILGNFRISLTDVSLEDATNALCLVPHNHYSHFNPQEHASKIVHCGHLFFEPLAGTVQGTSGLFSMVCVWRFYELAARLSGHKSTELQMLYDLFSKPYMGKKIERYMVHLQRSVWKDDLDAHVSKPKNWTAWF